jgi:general secretion pathway protein D
MQHQDHRPRYTRICVVASAIAFSVLTGCLSSPDLRRAEQLAEQGQWDQAVMAFREAKKKEPFNTSIDRRFEEAKIMAANAHYEEGRRHLLDNRLSEALGEFKLALTLNPARAEHHAALADVLRLKEAIEQVRAAERLQTLGRIDEAMEAYEKAVNLDPGHPRALENITKLTEQTRADRALGVGSQPITLRFQNAKLREVFEVLARAGNINVVFDREVKDDPITIFIKDTPFHEALTLILSTNNLFAKRIGPDTLLVIPNSKPKQDQYQDQQIRTFYLSNVKAKDMVNLLKTMLESKRMYVNEQINAIVIRDQPDKIRLAERIILANDRREAEVEFDVEILEVNRTKSQKLGLNFAKTAGAALVPPGFTGAIASTAAQYTFRQLTSLGPDSYLFSLPTSLLLDFFKQESDAKTLAAPKIRVINGKQASVNVGDKQPILLSTSNVLPGQAATGAVPTTSTVTSIEFKDTGVKLSVEPTIHLVDELTLKLKIEVTRLGDQVTLQASPEIKQFRFGTRLAETTLNIKNGESVILAGLIQDDDRKTRVTVPGLGDIPVLGHLFNSTTADTITTEVILTITPRIIRPLNMPNVETQTFWSGTETNYATTPLFTEVVSKTAVKTSMVSPSRPTLAQPPSLGMGTMPAAQPPAAPRPIPAAEVSKPAVPVAPSDVVAGGAVVLALYPPEVLAYVGQEFRVDLTADNLETLIESVVTVTYNPQVLEFRRALEGELLKQGASSASVTISASPTAGQLDLTMRRQGTPATGAGVLAMLFFQAKGPGVSDVEIPKAMVGAAGNKAVPVSTWRGQVRVR